MKRSIGILVCAGAVLLTGCGEQSGVGNSRLLNFTPAPAVTPTPSPTASTATQPQSAPTTVVVTTQQPAPKKSTAPQPTAPPAAYGLWVTSRGFTSDGTLQSQNPVLHVPAGGRVRFFNRDSVKHTWSGNDGSWDSGQVQPGQSWDYVTNRAGDFDFHDNDVPSFYGRLQVG